MNLSKIGQIALPVSNADVAQDYYSNKLALSFLFRFGTLVFYDCGGVRLMLEGSDKPKAASTCCIYLATEGIVARQLELKARGVVFDDEPHLIAKMPDHELWMCFFKDPDGNQFALMEEKR